MPEVKELLPFLIPLIIAEFALLFSTHILSDVEHICDEIAFLHDGKIALQGSIEEVRKIHKKATIRLEMEKREDEQALLLEFPYLKPSEKKGILLEESERFPEVLLRIAGRNYSLLRMERQEPTLEDLFMEVSGK